MKRFFVIVERDAGLFSLIQQVIANIPRALNESRIPLVYFGNQCCYWVPQGYYGKHNVWEYYFEPLIAKYGCDTLPQEIKDIAIESPPDPDSIGLNYTTRFFLSSNFGDHSVLRNQCLQIPFEWRDPDQWLRRTCARLIEEFIRPRQLIMDRVLKFNKQYFEGKMVIGLHIRGTDAISSAEPRLFRKNSLIIERYLNQIAKHKLKSPSAKIFVATDSVHSLNAIKEVYGQDVLSYSKILHDEGPAAGKGPTGELMPSYIAGNADTAVENGAEAVVDYLLLRRCNILIHNGASLARTVLLSEPDMPHINTHRPGWKMRLRAISISPYSLRRTLQKLQERLTRQRKIRFQQWHAFLKNN